MHDDAEIGALAERGRVAAAQSEWVALAEVLLEVVSMEQHENPLIAQRLSAERSSLATPDVLGAMASLLPDLSTPPIIRRALFALGSDAAEAILRQLGRSPDRHTRRAYLDALTAHPYANGPVLHGLNGRDVRLLVDACEVAGLRALELAIPSLEVLLRHEHEDVRAAAWHALERIGTPTAMALLYP